MGKIVGRKQFVSGFCILHWGAMIQNHLFGYHIFPFSPFTVAVTVYVKKSEERVYSALCLSKLTLDSLKEEVILIFYISAI